MSLTCLMSIKASIAKYCVLPFIMSTTHEFQTLWELYLNKATKKRAEAGNVTRSMCEVMQSWWSCLLDPHPILKFIKACFKSLTLSYLSCCLFISVSLMPDLMDYSSFFLSLKQTCFISLLIAAYQFLLSGSSWVPLYTLHVRMCLFVAINHLAQAFTYFSIGHTHRFIVQYCWKSLAVEQILLYTY